MMATKCRIHDVSTHRTAGICPGCEAEQMESMATVAQARANNARDKAISAERGRVHDLTADWWLAQAADYDETAELYDERARDLWSQMKSLRRLEKLGPHADERCPNDDEAARQTEIDRREAEDSKRYTGRRD